MNIPYGKQHITDEDIAEVVRVLKTDFLTQGPEIEKFERAFAKDVQAPYAVAVVNSGIISNSENALVSEVFGENLLDEDSWCFIYVNGLRLLLLEEYSELIKSYDGIDLGAYNNIRELVPLYIASCYEKNQMLQEEIMAQVKNKKFKGEFQDEVKNFKLYGGYRLLQNVSSYE